MITITNEQINIQSAIDAVRSEESGALVVFIGTVRNQTSSKEVHGLEYESYDAMAIKKMNEIADTAKEKWHVLKLAMIHRTGKLAIGDIAVVITVSTPHRNDAFEACQYVIDTLKKVVPIWKKERFADGEVWVSAHA